MSSPFALIRQYQKGMLAVFGILIMLVFVLGTAQFDEVIRTWWSSADRDTVATWKKGVVTGTELQRSMLVHRYAVNFLGRIVQETIENKGTPRVLNLSFENPGITSAKSLEDIFRKKVLAAKAEEVGIVVDDNAVHEFLRKLSDGLLDQADFARIMGQTLGSVRDRRATPEQVFEQLKLELAGQNLELMVTTGLGASTPTVAWTNFNRLNRRVKVEALPLKVDDFKAEVKTQPKESELKELFEKHKNSFGHPQVATPGFRQWKQIAFQYFKADYDRFLAEELPKVTEEEIKQEYELGVSRGEYKVQELPPSNDDKKKEEPKAEVDDKKEKPEAPAKDEPKKDESKKDEPKKEEAKKDDVKKPDEKPADSPKPEPAKPETAKPEPAKEEKKPEAKPEPKPEVKPEDKKPADVKPEPKDEKSEPKVEKKEEKKDGTSRMDRGRPEQDREFFVSALDDKPADAAKADDKKEEKKEEKKADAKSVKTDPPAAEKPKDEKAKDDKAADVKKEDAKKDEVKKDSNKVETKKEEPKPDDKAKPEEKTEAKEEKKPEEPKEPKFKPLAEVRDEVAKRVAKPRAQEAKKKAIAEVKKLVDAYGRERRVWEKFKDAEEPKLDFEALAAKLHIDYGKTELLSAVTMQDHELSKNDSLFVQKAFFSQIQPYKPQFPEFDGDVTYVWWKTHEEPEKVLEYKDAHDIVLDAWKKKEALKLAKKAAEDKVREVKDKESLAAVFGKDVIETNPFTWMTAGNVPWSSGMPMMSSVEGIDFPGRGFMEKVFSLKEGESGVAVNEPESIVYVVRVAQDMIKESQRRELFLETGNNMTARMLWFGEKRALRDQWHADLEKEFQVVWRERPQMQESDE